MLVVEVQAQYSTYLKILEIFWIVSLIAYFTDYLIPFRVIECTKSGYQFSEAKIRNAVGLWMQCSQHQLIRNPNLSLRE